MTLYTRNKDGSYNVVGRRPRKGGGYETGTIGKTNKPGGAIRDRVKGSALDSKELLKIKEESLKKQSDKRQDAREFAALEERNRRQRVADMVVDDLNASAQRVNEQRAKTAVTSGYQQLPILTNTLAGSRLYPGQPIGGSELPQESSSPFGPSSISPAPDGGVKTGYVPPRERSAFQFFGNARESLSDLKAENERNAPPGALGGFQVNRYSLSNAALSFGEGGFDALGVLDPRAKRNTAVQFVGGLGKELFTTGGLAGTGEAIANQVYNRPVNFFAQQAGAVSVFGGLESLGSGKAAYPSVRFQTDGLRGAPTSSLFGEKSAVLRGSARRISKAEIRKNTFSQAYDPRVYRTGNAVVERTPRQIRTVEYLQGGKVRATDVRVAKTGEGTLVAGRAVYTDTVRGAPRINEPNRIVGYVPKGGREVVDVKFRGLNDANGNFGGTYGGNVRTRDLSGPIKASQLYGAQRSQGIPKQGNIVGDLVLVKQTTARPAIFKNPGRAPALQVEPFKPYSADNGLRLPEYEFTPNAPPRTFSPYQRGTFRGGFRYRSSGDRVINIRSQVYPNRSGPNSLVVVFDGVPDLVPSSPVNAARGVADLDVGAAFQTPRVASQGAGFPARTQNLGLVNLDLSPRILQGPRKVSSLPESSIRTFPVLDLAPNVAQRKRSSLALDTLLSPKTVPRVGARVFTNQRASTAQIPRSEQAFSPLQVYDFSQDLATKQTVTFGTIGFGGGGGRAPQRDLPRRPSIPTFDDFGRFDPAERTGLRKPRTGRTRRGPSPFSSKDDLLGDLFRVEVGRKGNKYYYDLGVGGRDLVNQGKTRVLNTAAASIRVTPVSQSARQENIGSLLGADFREGSRGRFVQRNETRISTGGEKLQIPGESRRSRRLTKGSTYSNALRLSGSGNSMREIRRRLGL